MICHCGGVTRAGTWETIDGYTHFSDTCGKCGRYHRWPSKAPEAATAHPRVEQSPVRPPYVRL